MLKFLKILCLLLISVCLSLPASASDYPFAVGETIHYDIKKFFKVGEASLTFNGPQNYKGQEIVLITFQATSLNFLDEEKIYLDKQTFLPLFVERNLNIFGRIEKISEHYDQTRGVVRVIKEADGKTEEQAIERGKPIENIYGFIYRYRIKGDYTLGEKFAITVPTKDVEIKLIGKTTVKAADKKYSAYFMQSDPKQYDIWFEDGPGKLPLRIDGSAGMGKTAMIMREVTF